MNKKIWFGLYFPIFTACASLFASGWMDNARGAYFPILLKNTGLSATKGSVFFALASFMAILSSASASFIIGRWSLKALLYLGAGAFFLCPMGLIFFTNFLGVVITAFLFGLGLGWVSVGQNILISQIDREDIKRRLFSLLHCFYAAAAMTAPLSIVWLKNILPWNYLMIGVSFLSIPFFAGIFFLENKKANLQDRVEPPPLKSFWVLLWLMFLSFYISSELILSTRLVIFVEQTYSLSFAEASQHLFYFFLFMFIARVFFFLYHIKASSFFILIACVAGGLFSFALGHIVSTYFYSLIGLFMGPVFPVSLDEISKRWPKSFDVLISRVIAISSIFIVSAHMLVGVLTDYIGIQKALYSVPILLTLSLVVILYGYKKTLS